MDGGGGFRHRHARSLTQDCGPRRGARASSHEATLRSRRLVPLHGDAVAVRSRVQLVDLRETRRTRLRRLLRVASPDRGTPPHPRAVAPAFAQRADEPRPPFWIDDPDFDLDFHVRNTATPPPGSDQQLADLVARIIGRPLDRTRPLWETYVIEGLPDNKFGILTKVHHATIDGASGAELLTMMLDEAPKATSCRRRGGVEPPARAVRCGGARSGRCEPHPQTRPCPRVDHAHRPRIRQVDAQPDPRRRRQPGARRSARAARRDAQHRPAAQPEGETKGPLPSLSAPHTPFNAAITAHRRFAFRSTVARVGEGDQERTRRDRQRRGDGRLRRGLRTWLEEHDALTDQPLNAMIPVSIRTGEETERWSKPRVGHLLGATGRTRPTRSRACSGVHDAMSNAKGLFDAIPADALTDFAQFPPPAVFARAMRLSTGS